MEVFLGIPENRTIFWGIPENRTFCWAFLRIRLFLGIPENRTIFGHSREWGDLTDLHWRNSAFRGFFSPFKSAFFPVVWGKGKDLEKFRNEFPKKNLYLPKKHLVSPKKKHCISQKKENLRSNFKFGRREGKFISSRVPLLCIYYVCRLSGRST